MNCPTNTSCYFTPQKEYKYSYYCLCEPENYNISWNQERSNVESCTQNEKSPISTQTNINGEFDFSIITNLLTILAIVVISLIILILFYLISIPVRKSNRWNQVRNSNPADQQEIFNEGSNIELTEIPKDLIAQNFPYESQSLNQEM